MELIDAWLSSDAFKQTEIFLFKNVSVAKCFNVMKDNAYAYDEFLVRSTGNVIQGCEVIVTDQKLNAGLSQGDLEIVREIHEVVQAVLDSHKQHLKMSKVDTLYELFMKGLGNEESYLQKLKIMNKVASENLTRVDMLIKVGTFLLEKVVNKVQHLCSYKQANRLAKLKFKKIGTFQTPSIPYTSQPDLQQVSAPLIANEDLRRDIRVTTHNGGTRVVFVKVKTTCKTCKNCTK